MLVTGYDLGVAHHGGWARYARVPADWVVALPDGLSPREAMALGTAGLTAGLSIHALEAHGLAPADGPVLVLGASGGVGSTAVGALAGAGYEVWAATGKADQHDYLRGLGAHEIVTREETTAESDRPLEKTRWAAVVDPVGGAATAYALRTTRYGGAVALSGLTGGTGLATTVLPFILRSVSLLGIDSVAASAELRREVWARLAGDLRPRGLGEAIAREVDLEGIEPVLDALLAGEAVGRTVVRLPAGLRPGLGDALASPVQRRRRPRRDPHRLSLGDRVHRLEDVAQVDDQRALHRPRRRRRRRRGTTRAPRTRGPRAPA